VFDSSTKFPNGVLVGSTFDLGNFDECVNVDVSLEAHGRIQGQYCLASIKFDRGHTVMEEEEEESAWGFNTSAWHRIQVINNGFSTSYMSTKQKSSNFIDHKEICGGDRFATVIVFFKF